MNIITNQITFTQADSDRSSNNIFGQKQAWFNEMEKARQLLVNNRQDNASVELPATNESADDQLTPFNENNPGAQALTNTRRVTDTQTGFTQYPDAGQEIVASRIASMPLQIGPSPLIFGAGALSGLLPVTADTRQTSISQQVLHEAENLVRSEIQPQNLQFVNGPDGIKIFFRDYRLNDSEALKVIDKIRRLLAKLNIGISEIIVNGSLIEQNHMINQEAS